MAEKAIIVVDMLRGFLEEGYPLFCGEESRRIIPHVREILERERHAAVFYVCDNHAPDDAEFKMFPPHCVRGSLEAELIPELRGYPGTIVPKTRYSGFYNTDLAERLAAAAPRKVIVVGVCTDICVMHTVADLRNRDYAVEVPEEGVASFDAEAHAFALKHIERVLGATVLPAMVSRS